MGSKYTDFIIVDRDVAPAEMGVAEDRERHGERHGGRMGNEAEEETLRAFSERYLVLPHSYQANEYPADVTVCPVRGDHLFKRFSGRAGSESGSGRGGGVGDGVEDGHFDLVTGTECDESGKEKLRSNYGLPTEAVVLANFNTIDKVEPVSFSAWMNVLRRVPGYVPIHGMNQLMNEPINERERVWTDECKMNVR